MSLAFGFLSLWCTFWSPGKVFLSRNFIAKTSSDCVSHDCLGLKGEELECTNGFLSMRDVKGQMIDGIDDFNSVRLIPDMNFTCSGTIEKVTVAGIRHKDNQTPVRLQIWRPENTLTEDGIRYRRVKNIELSSSICKMFKMTRMLRDINNNTIPVYECTLKKNMQILVEPGDILGIGLPPERKANFELYSVTESRLTNYVFERGLGSTVLPNRVSETTVHWLPLIRMKVDPGM